MQLQLILLLIAFSLSGIILKTADFLGEKNSSFVSYFSAAISALIFSVLMSESTFSSSLILGIIIGVLIVQKVDRSNMVFGLILTFVLTFFFKLKPPIPWLLVVVTIFTVVDEIGHEKHNLKSRLAFFFDYRLSLKLVVIVLTILSLISIVNLLSFLCLDISYDLTNRFLINKL